ncbi:MAG: ABC transporter permease [Thermogemmatispora sp.]|uniref:ABC transporter permease n=1 Tax=Thermogemmatispora sp. TaxID=1968838 RepID=UPI0019F26615|nr:ABC transporter permease [Thermogemmatispora sp.]MBE3564689.1 ABC transporter permease [Thermogemmatispora sp.]
MRYLTSPSSYDLSDPGSIPNLLLQHFTIVAISMLIALAIAFPLALLIVRYRRLRLPVITLMGLLYTIPGLALIGILVTVTGLSLATVVIPLVLYAQLVLVRNISTAISSIDPLLIEVGRAMGMNRLQILWRVTLPLAMPVIIAGIRVATVTTIGIASLASLVDQGGLGDLIFKSIPLGDYDTILGGAILLALFALVADLLLLLLQRALERGRSQLALAS